MASVTTNKRETTFGMIGKIRTKETNDKTDKIKTISVWFHLIIKSVTEFSETRKLQRSDNAVDYENVTL